MAKAEYVTLTGTRVTIEGKPREVAEMLKHLNTSSSILPDAAPRSKVAKKRMLKATPTNLISSLIDGGFFRKPKDLATVKSTLEESGHYYPVTTLSPTMLRFVRGRQLRRIKDNNKWLYTG